MPGRLIGFITALLIIVTFIGFNIENSSDIRVWFGKNGVLEDVPIFVSFFVMYLIGVLSVLPFILVWGRKKRQQARFAGREIEGNVSRTGSSLRVSGAKESKAKSEESPDNDAEAEERSADEGE